MFKYDFKSVQAVSNRFLVPSCFHGDTLNEFPHPVQFRYHIPSLRTAECCSILLYESQAWFPVASA